MSYSANEIVVIKDCIQLLQEITTEWNNMFNKLEKANENRNNVVDIKTK